MAAPNVGELLYMRGEPDGRTWTFAEFRKEYRFEADGVNLYYGVNQEAVDHFLEHGEALRRHHDVMKDVLKALIESDRPEKSVVVGLWPYQPDDPFTYVDRNLPLIERLASELADYQQQAAQRGKTLRIVVRYASEMNDPRTEKQPWGRTPGKTRDKAQQEKFKSSFRLVRQAFRKVAGDDIPFTFSPGLRSDITGERYEVIAEYWPGDLDVDRLSCTWFVGKQENYLKAVEVLTQYCLDQVGRALHFGIDELGGVDGESGNDRVLEQMFRALAGLKPHGITFDYVTLFLNAKWRNDATLAFLRPPEG